MTLWLVRAGSRGEHEQNFLDEGRVYVAWEGLDVDLSELADRQALIRVLEERFPDEKAKALVNWSSQVWPFVKDMAQGDWVVMPSKLQSGLYFGELTSEYHYEAAGPNPYYHWRSVNWFSGLIPRTVFPQVLLYSFGAFMTICRIQRNDAEARVRTMAANKWQPESVASSAPRTPASSQGGSGNDEAADAANVNLEELAADQIERLIEARFKGHELASLVEAILQAEGYTTYRSPAGADGGAETCLFVSWSGFRPNVQKELARDFFRVRLWSRKELLEMLFVRYNQLPEEIRLALPLKRVWMVAQQND